MNEIEAGQLVEALFDRCYTQLVRYAVRSLTDRDLAEDLVQDAFLELYGTLRSGKCIGYPKAWAMCVLRRAVNRHIQERFEYEQLDDFEHVPSADHESSCLSLIADYLYVLSRREEEVLQLIADGCSTPEVAQQLFISQKTVKNHLAAIYQKLDARDRTQAVVRAVRMGIIRID